MAELKSKLVLLVHPMIIATHELEPTFRELFQSFEGKNPSPPEVAEFLEGRGLESSIDVGENERGDVLVAFKVRGEQLFAIRML